MKKFVFAAFALAALASCKKSADTPSPTTPVNLTASDISKDYAAGKTVNFFTVNIATSAALTAPVTGQGQVWNYSNLSESGTYNEAALAATGTFPSGAYFLQNQITFADGNPHPIFSEYEIGDSGWVRRGVAVPAMTLDFPDLGATIAYKAQECKYNKLLPLTPPFPIKFGDKANVTGAVRTENFTVNAPALGLNNTPGAQTYTNNQSVECMASGKLTLKGFDKAMDVVILKAHRKMVYNYFLGGAPAPSALLDVLGITDGFTTDYYWYDYYNPGGEGFLGSIAVDASNHVLSAYFKKK